MDVDRTIEFVLKNQARMDARMDAKFAKAEARFAKADARFAKAEKLFVATISDRESKGAQPSGKTS